MRLAVSALAIARGGRLLFEDLELAVAPGEAVALTAPNGAGKSSLLRATAGLLRPAAGAIAFFDADTLLDPDEARAARLHLLGHHDGLSGGRTARDELAFWARWQGGDATAVDAATRAVDLAPLLPLEVRRLSAGQRRRLAVARLLAAPRPLWLLDEPLAPLDSAWRARLGEVMVRHLAGGGSILAAAHDPLPIPAREVRLPAPALAA
ncbi:MAG: heme ABC exporter ATP-binding protein CcmA [Caulobacteraceae bacterium]|nr:heme ABC exporter ATP-binding protein CcmA [Caulobacter sp.]